MVRLLKWLLVITLIIVLYFVIVIYYVGYSNPAIKKADAAVVLGAAQYNGRPSPIFTARLDHAQKLLEDQKVEKIIVTGGKGLKEDVFSEGLAGRNYLIDQGVDAQNIIFEELSHNTQENIHELVKLMEENNIKSVIFVSDRFHMFRIAKMANEAGLQYQLSPTTTSPVQKNKKLEFIYVLQEIRNYISFVMLSS